MFTNALAYLSKCDRISFIVQVWVLPHSFIFLRSHLVINCLRLKQKKRNLESENYFCNFYIYNCNICKFYWYGGACNVTFVSFNWNCFISNFNNCFINIWNVNLCNGYMFFTFVIVNLPFNNVRNKYYFIAFTRSIWTIINTNTLLHYFYKIMINKVCLPSNTGKVLHSGRLRHYPQILN